MAYSPSGYGSSTVTMTQPYSTPAYNGYPSAGLYSSTQRAGGTNANDTLSGGATLAQLQGTQPGSYNPTPKEMATLLIPPGMENFMNVPGEVFAFYAWQSNRDGFMGMAMFIFALFMVIVGGLACILTTATGNGFNKWGWSIMWGVGIIFFFAGVVFLGMATQRTPDGGVRQPSPGASAAAQ